MLLESFLGVAQRRGDGVAVQAANEDRLTYDDLATKVRRLVNGLRGAGVQPGQIVATWLDNGSSYVATILALAGVGAVHLPISRRADQSQAAWLLSLVVPRLLITADGESLKGISPCLSLDELQGCSHLLPYRSSHAGICRLLQTSGSTGDPRLVVWRQDALKSEIENWISYTGTTEHDVIFNVHTLDGGHAVDIHVLPALLAGATLVLSDFRDPVETLRALVRCRATVLSLLPHQYESLARAAPVADITRVPSLRLPMCGGAFLSARTAQEASRSLGLRIRRIYGSTEFGMVLGNMSDTDQACRGMRPVPGVQVRLEPLSPNSSQVGEIAAKSSHSGSGYYGEDARASGFRDGWYYTGDVAQRDELGEYHIVGRRIDAIMTAGGLIFASQFEETLRSSCPAEEVIVLTRFDHHRADAVLVLAVPSRSRDYQEVNDCLTTMLSKHNVVGEVYVTSKVPRTPVGKPDRAEILRTYAPSLRARVAQGEEDRKPG